MAVEALPFVNWILWAGLAAGTLLVVGLTEALGGTTRGYRLFMAWLVAVLAALLLASELTLPPGIEAGSTEALRRPLVIGFAVGSVAYLLASIRNWPRTVVAIASALVGLAALVTLAAAGGTRSAPLFAAQIVIASIALGAVTAGMLLGHWYLVTPRLSPAPLRRIMWMLVGSLVLQGLLFAAAVLAVDGEALSGPMGWLTWLRLGVGVLLPIVVTVLALLASRAPSLQASTGLLYIGLALVLAGSIAGSSIGYLTGVPV